ncbi:Lrp/AsnC family transcriptional regulator [Streptomyces sp. NPDC006872]|uniref:Lrp/AsnC family transcriptional regulator n=1 Tax=Streptomyces sp. NPDC006872 TaxID=3155720 RepID=UPI0033E1AD79
MLDAVDGLIVAALRSDGRATVRSISKLVGLPETTTRARVNSLLESGRVSVIAVLHPSVEPSEITLYIRVRLSSGWASQIADSILGHSYWLAEIIGEPEVIATFDVTSLSHAARLTDEIAQLPFVSMVTTDPVLGVYMGAGTPVETGGEAGLWPALDETRLDAQDRQLIRSLQVDGRATYTALARSAGLSLSQARRRVLDLIDSGTIRIWTTVQTAEHDLARAVLDLTVNPKTVMTTVERLVRRPGVVSVSRMCGTSALALDVAARDAAELGQLVGDISAHSDLISCRVYRIRLLRRQLQQRLRSTPDASSEEGDAKSEALD